MKKEYIKPEIAVEEILLESSMLTNSLPQTEGPVEPWSNKRQDRRGSWGNLWNQDEN